MGEIGNNEVGRRGRSPERDKMRRGEARREMGRQ